MPRAPQLPGEFSQLSDQVQLPHIGRTHGQSTIGQCGGRRRHAGTEGYRGPDGANRVSIERIGDSVEIVPPRRTVVTALPLKLAARARLAELLNARVVDVREVVDQPDLVLTPSSSPQLIGALSRTYPGSRIVVVELDDWEFDIELPGPVKRLLNNGAAAYVVADSLEDLAHKLTTPRDPGNTADDPSPVHELPSAETVDDLVMTFLRQAADEPSRARPKQD